MIQDSPPSVVAGSRLVRFLTDLGVSDMQVSHQQFAERLAQQIDFAASLRLATVLGKVSAIPAVSAEPAAESAGEKFLRLRAAVVQSVLASFAVNPGHTQLKLPNLALPQADDAAGAFAPYLRFYAAQQRLLEVKVQNLHLQVRDAVSTQSARLAQLCALDEAIGDTLAHQARKCFAHCQKLLGQRFAYWFDRYQQDSCGATEQTAVWAPLQRQFNREMRDLLLAEVEARLSPALGLIEASNDHVPILEYE
jgi:hypothetical protein